MAVYILVHGSWHGAWCWYKIVPRLQNTGHTAIAIDLPGHGKDHTTPQQITLQTYVDTICRVIDAQSEPVILVGHSRGGLPITQAAEQRPDRVKRLIYLAAFLIPGGETMLPIARGDRDSLIMPNLEVNVAEGWDMLHESAYREALYADCTDEEVALAQALLVPEPLAPASTPLQTTPENFERVPRAYIQLLQDRAVSLAAQRKMLAQIPCDPILSIDASHSAYFSRPDELASHLLAFAS